MGKTLTIFDLDNTLIKGDSSTLWSRFMVREGWVNDLDYLAREARLMEDYDRGEMNIADYVALIQAPLIGVPKQDVDALRTRRGYAARVSAGMGFDSDFTGEGRADAGDLGVGQPAGTGGCGGAGHRAGAGN